MITRFGFDDTDPNNDGPTEELDFIEIVDDNTADLLRAALDLTVARIMRSILIGCATIAGSVVRLRLKLKST